MEERMRRILRGSVLVLFFLMLFGMALMALGWVWKQPLLAILGLAFLLIPAFAFRATVPPDVLAGAFVGATVGMLVGAGVGALLGTGAETLIGIAGGAVAGGYCGALAPVFVIKGISRVSIGPLDISLWEPPTAVVSVLFTLGMVVGAVLGARGWHEGIPRVFGVAGGAGVIGGFVGMVTGAVVGVRLPRRR